MMTVDLINPVRLSSKMEDDSLSAPDPPPLETESKPPRPWVPPSRPHDLNCKYLVPSSLGLRTWNRLFVLKETSVRLS